MIEAVFFDLYETLVTEFDPDWKPGARAGQRLGVDPDAFDREWRARQQAQFIGEFPDFPSVLRGICRALGSEADEQAVRALTEERIAAKMKVFAHIDAALLAALGEIRGSAVKLAVISNSNGPEEVAGWPGSELAPLFDDTIFSHEIGCAKPDAEIYTIACRRLGVAPERSAFIGDGGSDELRGAEEAGMEAYWASWFIDRWPEWRRAQEVYKRAAAYPRLRTPAEVVGVVK